ncbi:hypothetical protein CS369_01005 [Candidatus Symbiopectobacterium sp. 'North America']|uniref:hypothetical protein n=1 Tax=Candidatus Symbiopectobacterium sp. 'North America' TaxID=2794574 RepID=UPI0018CB2924|nr:hypothetical protein [Candidatus Symbiopectobacterium sp. 'North America']MBG6243788.1 hypothetical protein [Candidatus Symbiopectobacterium sp. 'North America']
MGKSINESQVKTITDFAGLSRDSESPYSYLIELTSNADIISHFKKRDLLGGSTDSSSGLLRSLPIIAKGNNPKKVISDGEDSGKPKELTTALHEKHNICKIIKECLLSYNKIHKTVEVDIFFISLAKDGVDGDNVKFWRKLCIGDNNAFVVSNYLDLVNILAKIAKKEKLNFIDKSGF